MRVPLSWLREYVDVDLSPEQLAERLTLLGMEVKGIERLGTGWSRVVVGELLTVDAAPDADRLSLTTRPRGRRPADAARSSAARPTSRSASACRSPCRAPCCPAAGASTARLAGVESQGMLCSGDELGLSSDAEGILILPPATPLGLPLEDLVGDIVLDVDVKPNRGDALSIIGLAREVAAATGATAPLAGHRGRRVGRRDLRPPVGGRPGPDPLPAVRGPLPRWRARRPVAVRRPASPARGRRATHLQRRGCQQLRDARAGQAHPYLRCRRGHATAASWSARAVRASA